MDYGDYYWGLYRGYYKDPFPDSLRSTRQFAVKPLRRLDPRELAHSLSEH